MTIEKETVSEFCRLAGDYNPIHTDPKYAATTKFTRCIVPGTLVNSIMGGLIAGKFAGAILVNQYLEFIAPLFIGQEFDIIVNETILTERKSIIHLIAQASGKTLVVCKSLIYKP